MNPIILSGQIAATNADILNGTRLATAPYPGIMTFKYASTVALDGTNDYSVSIMLPGGEVPIDRQLAPLAAGDGNLDDRLALVISFFIQQGGQVLFSATETGTAVFTYLVRFAPRR